MHPVKRLVLAALCGTALLAPRPAHAVISATTLDGWGGLLNLVDSRLTVQVSEDWIDVEEEAELQAVPSWSNGTGPWIATGTITVPKGTAITGCMLWNGDTLLMGKLRGKGQANKIFDSLVPPVTTRWPVDPLLIEQLSETVYNVKLFPLPDGGTRRFRIRYLVPRQAGTLGMPVVPLLRQVAGAVTEQFRLRLRGKVEGFRIATTAGIWPVDLPFSDMLSTTGEPQLLWDAPSVGAVRGKADSGRWAGDYVLYTGSVPDSVIKKTTIRSETVVLWSWIRPQSFLTASGYYGENRYLTTTGYEVLNQASLIDQIAQRAGTEGGRMGLVADLGLDDAPKTWPLADSAATTFKSMRQWLLSLNQATLEAIIPSASGGSSGTVVVPNKEIAELRQRFRVDMREVGALYSADSGVIRHLIVVTAGLSASSASLDAVDPTLLPAGVAVQSSRLQTKAGYDTWVSGVGYVYTPASTPASTWPGIDLASLVSARPTTSEFAAWNHGIMLPKVRTLSAARLSIGSASGMIRRNVLLERDAAGRLGGSLNVHAPSLEKTVKWEIFDDSGRTLQSWNVTPSWSDVGSDSVLPRLWAKSETPVAPALEGQDLGPVYGVVDMFHSLLATPSDTVGAVRQKALRDSGVPFLTYAEIFPRQGYGTEAHTNGEGEGNAVHDRAARGALRMSWIAATRTLRIDLSGLTARAIEIRDLQGRLLATIPASQLANLSSFDWKAPSGLARGLLLVTVRTDAGMRTGRIMVH